MGWQDDPIIETGGGWQNDPIVEEGQSSGIAKRGSAVLQGIPTRPLGSAAENVVRLAKDTVEGFAPPTSMEAVKRFLNPNLGQFGPNRFAQDVIEEGRSNVDKMAEGFVQKPGINKYPEAAAAVATLGSLAGQALMSGPKDIPGMVAGDAILNKTGLSREMMRTAGRSVKRGIGANRGANALRETETELRQRALGFTKRKLNTETKIKSAENAVSVVKEKELMGALTGPKKAFEKVSTLKEKAGEEIGNFLKSQGQSLDEGFIVRNLENLKTKLVEDGLGDQVGKVDVAINALRARIPRGGDPLIPRAPEGIRFVDANRVKTIFQMRGKFAQDSAQQAVDREIAGVLRGSIDGELERIAATSGKTKEFSNFIENKRIYGALTSAEDALLNRISSDKGNRVVGILDVILAAPQVASGNVVSAMGTVGLKQALDQYGLGLSAAGLDKVASFLSTLPEKEAKKIISNPNALQVIATRIGQNELSR